MTHVGQEGALLPDGLFCVELSFDQLPSCSLLIIFELLALRDVQHHGVTFLAIGGERGLDVHGPRRLIYSHQLRLKRLVGLGGKDLLNEGVEGGSIDP